MERAGRADPAEHVISVDELKDLFLAQRPAVLREVPSKSKSRNRCSTTLVYNVDIATRGAGTMVDTFLQDVRYAARLFRRNPVFTLTASLSLALGIGVNTAVFSVAEAALLRSWPAMEPERLLRITATTPQGRSSVFSYPDYQDLGDQSRAVEGVVAFSRHAKTLRLGAESRPILNDVVSPNYFAVLGIRAARGRVFSAADAAGEPIVVISDTLWRRAFNADPLLVGHAITLTGRGYTVLGIAPPGFRGLERAVPTDLWLLATTEANKAALANRSHREFELIGRLRTGATPTQARGEMDTIGRRLASDYPAVNQSRHITIISEDERLAGVLVPSLMLMTAVGLVLLISCANVAGLLLGLSAMRRRETAVRLALGVSRRRLVRQLLTESTLLASAGAALGLLMARWLLRLQPALMPPTQFEIGLDLRLNGPVVIFTLAASAFAVLAFGLAPALEAANMTFVPALKNDERGGGRRAHRLSLRNVFVLGEIALSVVLVTTSALLVRSLFHSQRISLGINTAKQLTFFDLAPGVVGHDAERSLRFFEAAAEHARAVPGVTRATFARRVLLSASGGGAQRRVTIPSVVLPQDQPNIRIKFNVVSPGYFGTVGTRLLRGRPFTAADGPSSSPVAVISETMADRFWPGDDPVGRHIVAEGNDCEIIGVVEDAKINRVHEAAEPYVYFSFAQLPMTEATLIAETTGDRGAVVAAIRDRIRGLDDNVPISVSTIDELFRLAFWEDSMAAWFLGTLGALGIFLAAVGLYGIIAQRVNQRRHELGVRMALGADPRNLMRLVLVHGLTLAAIGTGAGLIASLGTARLVSSLLYGVTPTDPLAFAVSAAAVMVVSLAATCVPARRALTVDPLVALRCE